MTPDPAGYYQALSARDPRFDGVFFVGVTTTRIYCRPVCRARLPRRESCRFFASAAAAEGAGFRPCLRCRPERAPGRAIVDATSRLAHHAAARITAGALNEGTVDELAAQLHIGPRQLRRALRREYGAGPVELAQTHRLLLAKQLLTESRLSVAEVAFASGFTSLRRFNALFQLRYRMSPRDLRRANPAELPPCAAITLSLDHRPPLDWAALLSFLDARAIAGVEAVEGERYLRSAKLGEHRGWVAVRPAARSAHALAVEVSLSLAPMLAPLLARLRSLFDLDAEPATIARHLAADPRLAPQLQRRPGLRIPGAMDGFEIAWRAVLGQQVSVRAATTLAGRLSRRFGEPMAEAPPGLSHYPIAADRLVEVPPQRLTELGVPRPRADCILALARVVAEEGLRLEPGICVEETLIRLRSLPGIGPWTAQYIALRALHWPDAFPHADLGLRKALGGITAVRLLHEAEAWRPWRGYAAVHLWQSLNDAPKSPLPREEIA